MVRDIFALMKKYPHNAIQLFTGLNFHHILTNNVMSEQLRTLHQHNDMQQHNVRNIFQHWYKTSSTSISRLTNQELVIINVSFDDGFQSFFECLLIW